MRFDVLLTEHAERDLEELYDYIAAHDAPGNAARVLDRIEKVLQSLSTFPERGSHPKELLALGIREYRQTFFKPYRLIYRIVEKRVYIYLIVDGRRDMQALLARRLFGA
ncbi:MAG: plasmid stabilization protein [Betaproteobacteria bacterium RIFCSPLOWO2_12_FULL_66_14]|nr:MAG: plasmid stabilization protein [Betaproteobacteria bacterium RIFCSPLOWO2_12_FULL_66_14]